MKSLLETIKKTFEIIPDKVFESCRWYVKSIYIKLDGSGYKFDWSGKYFTDKSGKAINCYEIKNHEIKLTKAETIAHIESEFKKISECRIDIKQVKAAYESYKAKFNNENIIP
jgi:hypothetical protein